MRLNKTYLKIFILLLLCPIFWFLVTHLLTAFKEWSKMPVYLHQGISTLFSIDKIRYSIELNDGYFLDRFFYNKIGYLIGVLFHSLSVVSPRSIFVGQNFEPVPLIFLPFWFVGMYKLIRNKKIIWFILFFLVSVLIYLTGQTSPYYLIFIIPFYLYAICESFK